VILEAATFGLGGLEPLYGIPGTVGGAVIVNAGAHGVDIGSFLRSASVLVSSEKIINCKPNWFKFGYRTSKLKGINSESAPVVVSVIFQFQRRKKEDILEKIGEFKKWRSSHQPIGEKTCGSIFKNPAGTDDAQGGQKEKTAGYILEQAGAKRLVVDGVRVAKIHSNWVINNGKAKAFDVRSLIEKMRSVVEEKFSLTLVEEVEYLGRWDEPRYQ
jgi:UDP-N-acetylmuramate dehydrogenase